MRPRCRTTASTRAQSTRCSRVPPRGSCCLRPQIARRGSPTCWRQFEEGTMDRMERQELMDRFRVFNAKGGKFRVAITNTCNLDCFFCHNEGMSNPRRGEVAVGGGHLDKD